MFEVLRNDEAYDAFDSEVCHEYMSLGMAIVIFIVQQSYLVIYTEKCELTKAVMHYFSFQTSITRYLFSVKIDEPLKPGKRKPPARFDDSRGQWQILVSTSVRQIRQNLI